MTQTHIQPQTLSLELPRELVLHVTQEQFETLAAANRDLQLERTASGELIVNPPTGGESGRRNLSISTQLGNCTPVKVSVCTNKLVCYSTK